MNSSNPPRTTTDQHNTKTQDQEDNQYNDDDLPALPGDIPQAADEDNVSFVCETILLHDGEGNKMPFNYVQSKYTTSSMTSSGTYWLMEKCHRDVFPELRWRRRRWRRGVVVNGHGGGGGGGQRRRVNAIGALGFPRVAPKESAP